MLTFLLNAIYIELALLFVSLLSYNTAKIIYLHKNFAYVWESAFFAIISSCYSCFIYISVLNPIVDRGFYNVSQLLLISLLFPMIVMLFAQIFVFNRCAGKSIYYLPAKKVRAIK